MPTGVNLLLKLVRRGLLAPAERAGFFPARHYLALALEALARDDLDAAVAALEACGRRRRAAPRAALVREQVIFRIRTLTAGHRAAAERAAARAGYLEALVTGDRARLRRAGTRRRALGLGASVVAAIAAAAALWVALRVPAGPLPAAGLALLALLAAAVAAAVVRRPAGSTPLPAAEASRLIATAAGERRLAAAEREAAEALGRLEARLLAMAAPPADGAETAGRPEVQATRDGTGSIVLSPDAYRRVPPAPEVSGSPAAQAGSGRPVAPAGPADARR